MTNLRANPISITVKSDQNQRKRSASVLSTEHCLDFKINKLNM